MYIYIYSFLRSPVTRRREERGEAKPVRELDGRTAGWKGGGGWKGVAIGNPRPHDQCHGAFIVLQQKGAHQSTGISSRLISRGHPLLARPPSSLSATPSQPCASDNTPYGTVAAAISFSRFPSVEASSLRVRVLHFPSSDLPPLLSPSPPSTGSDSGSVRERERERQPTDWRWAVDSGTT